MIEIEDLHKSFDGQEVLKGVNLHIPKGRMLEVNQIIVFCNLGIIGKLFYLIDPAAEKVVFMKNFYPLGPGSGCENVVKYIHKLFCIIKPFVIGIEPRVILEFLMS